MTLKFFLPDWEDRIDPHFDFVNDKFSFKHKENPYKNDIYAHEILNNPYDGILISLSLFQSKLNLKPNGKEEILIRDKKNIRDYLRIPKDSRIETLGDCGAFSYVRSEEPPKPFFSTENVSNIYEKLGFDYGVSVDHMAVSFVMEKEPGDLRRRRREFSEKERMRRIALTVSNAKEFLDHHKEKKYKFTPIGVVQGINKETYAAGVKELVGYGYDYLALGSLVGYSTKEIINILSFIKPHIGDARLHLFGVLRPHELKNFERLGVVSFDSASYLRKAWLRSGQNYLSIDQKWYAAIRVPYSTQQKVSDGALKIHIGQKQLKLMEENALTALREYEKGHLPLNDTLDKVMEYDDLLLRNSNDGQSLRKKYEITLKDKPWEKCGCAFCRTNGIDSLIFRGSNRNKRRGFHNTWLFNNYLKS